MGFTSKFENYDPESHSKWFSHQSPIEQARFNAFIDMLTNPYLVLPDRYKGSFSRMNKDFRLNADPSLLTDEQLYLMDQQLVRTYYDTNVMARILAPVTTYQANPRWLSQHYTISGDTYPEFSKGSATAFRTQANLKLGVEPTVTAGVGAAIKWELPFTLIKEGTDGIYNPDFWHSYKAGELMGVFWNERLALGTAGENTSGDLSITGLHNYSGVTTQATGAGADNDLTAAGDIDFTIRVLLQNLLTVYEPGNNILISTPGPATEPLLHDATYTDRGEVEILQKKWFDTGLVSAWYVDGAIEADTNATTTGRIMMVRLGSATVKREIIYPLQKKPLLSKEFEDDIAYALLVADVLTVYDTSAVVINSGDQTTTSAGVIQNGLFMQGRGYKTPFETYSPTYIGVS